MGGTRKVIVILSVLAVILILGCMVEEVAQEGEEQQDSDQYKKPNNMYRIGDIMEGVPEKDFSTTFTDWKRRDPISGRVKLYFYVTLTYEGKTEAAYDASRYFDDVLREVSVSDGEYEFSRAIGELSYGSGYIRLLPKEKVTGWIKFSVPDWFEPNYLVAKEDGKTLWKINLLEGAEKDNGDQPGTGLNRLSVTLSGPSRAETGDSIIISIKNSGNIDITRWTLSGLISESGTTLTVGSQMAFATILTGSGPWTFEVLAEAYSGETCFDTLVVKRA